MKYSIGDLFFLSIQCTHEPLHVGPLGMCVYVVVQFYPLVKFFFPLFWGMVMHDNQLKTKANKNYSKDKTNHFRYIKILTCSETEGNKTKEMYYSLLSLKMISFVLSPSLAAKYEF